MLFIFSLIATTDAEYFTTKANNLNDAQLRSCIEGDNICFKRGGSNVRFAITALPPELQNRLLGLTTPSRGFSVSDARKGHRRGSLASAATGATSHSIRSASTGEEISDQKVSEIERKYSNLKAEKLAHFVKADETFRYTSTQTNREVVCLISRFTPEFQATLQPLLDTAKAKQASRKGSRSPSITAESEIGDPVLSETPPRSPTELGLDGESDTDITLDHEELELIKKQRQTKYLDRIKKEETDLDAIYKLLNEEVAQEFLAFEQLERRELAIAKASTIARKQREENDQKARATEEARREKEEEELRTAVLKVTQEQEERRRKEAAARNAEAKRATETAPLLEAKQAPASTRTKSTKQGCPSCIVA